MCCPGRPVHRRGRAHSGRNTAGRVGSVLDTALVESTIREHDVRGIVHLAGRKSAPDSVRHPIFYYNENVGGMISLLDAAIRADVRRVVLSSSAAVYGTTDVSPVSEDADCRPENPYGESKLNCEKILAHASTAHDIGYISLRYFNVAGAATAQLADRGGDNLIPRVFSPRCSRTYHRRCSGMTGRPATARAYATTSMPSISRPRTSRQWTCWSSGLPDGRTTWVAATAAPCSRCSTRSKPSPDATSNQPSLLGAQATPPRWSRT
nr:NAD-dependent epimerase/dehydratase family protein [Fodinicola feengrottensis]